MNTINKIIKSSLRELDNTLESIDCLNSVLIELKQKLEKLDSDKIERTDLLNNMGFINNVQSTINRMEGEALYHINSEIFKKENEKSHLQVVEFRKPEDDNSR